jgi:hypothetical protein
MRPSITGFSSSSAVKALLPKFQRRVCAFGLVRAFS